MVKLKIIEDYLLQNCYISNCEIKEKDSDNIIYVCSGVDSKQNICKFCRETKEIIINNKNLKMLKEKGFLKK